MQRWVRAVENAEILRSGDFWRSTSPTRKETFSSFWRRCKEAVLALSYALGTIEGTAFAQQTSAARCSTREGRDGTDAHFFDLYHRRWLVEEYFKALKTGCSLERRQVESYSALKNN
jgi:hypothetical protein